MNVLRVGDPHARQNNLEDSEKLMLFVEETAIKYKVDRIELLGDLFHNHSVLNLFVIEFWDKWLNRLSDICDTVVLVGNHDQSGDYSSDAHALSVFKHIKKGTLSIVDKMYIKDKIAYVSYHHDKDEFVKIANFLAEQGATVLVCHQTFTGSKYESGIYAPDGIDPSLLSDKYIHIIPGHIHSKQEFGRIQYPGTAKWDTANDANERKGIHIYEHEDATGRVINKTFFSTESVCSPILSVVWKEGTEKPVIPTNARATIELIGTSDWISKEKQSIKGVYSIQTTFTDNKKLENRLSGNSLEEFVMKHFDVRTGVNRELVLKYMKELQIV